MLNGAVPVTNLNGYYAKEFRDEQEVVFYRWNKLNDLPEKITCLLEDKQKLNSISLMRQQTAEKYHTWFEQAKRILEIVETYKTLKYIHVS